MSVTTRRFAVATLFTGVIAGLVGSDGLGKEVVGEHGSATPAEGEAAAAAGGQCGTVAGNE